MLWRVQCTYPKVSWLAVVPIAMALVSCGGDGLTGPSAVDPAVDSAVVAPPLKVVSVDSGSLEDDAVGESVRMCRMDKVLICHRGRDSWVAKPAVRGHLRHGDTLGSCSVAVSCPCYTAADIQTTAQRCTGTVNPTCSASGVQVSLLLACDPGGSVPPGILGIYLTRTSDGGYCSRNEASGNFTESPLSAEQYTACETAIFDSGYCS